MQPQQPSNFLGGCDNVTSDHDYKHVQHFRVWFHIKPDRCTRAVFAFVDHDGRAKARYILFHHPPEGVANLVAHLVTPTHYQPRADHAAPVLRIKVSDFSKLEAQLQLVIAAFLSVIKQAARSVHVDAIDPADVLHYDFRETSNTLLRLLGLLIDSCESFTETDESTVRASGRRHLFSGTRFFGSVRAYHNQLMLRMIEKHYGKTLQTLRVDDDNESTLLVLAYEMVSRFDLAEFTVNNGGTSRCKHAKPRNGNSFPGKDPSKPYVVDRTEAGEVLGIFRCRSLKCFEHCKPATEWTKRKLGQLDAPDQRREGTVGEAEAVDTDRINDILYRMSHQLFQIQILSVMNGREAGTVPPRRHGHSGP
ncbi:hypothetical protein ACQY0O_000316 [Thecaphora frezii]